MSVRGLSEGRLSLRESLRIFLVLQKQSSYHFEDLAYRYSKARPNCYQFSKRQEATCGNFVKAFVSLFISEREISRNVLGSLIDGSALNQYYNHSNLMLHDLLHESPFVPKNFKGQFSIASQSFSKFQASSSQSLLATQLLLCESDVKLPRVFLVSMSWVMTAKEPNIGDHKFVLIKHTNDNFQLVQNYRADPSLNRKAMNLRDWQKSQHPYSPRGGFDRKSMQLFLEDLLAFSSAGPGGFCTKLHASLFGVKLIDRNAGLRSYWPSVSFSELTDDCIHGSGHRCMANQLELDYTLLGKL